MHGQTDEPLLHLESPFAGPIRQTIFSLVKKPLSKVLRLDTLNAMYAELRRSESDGPFLDRAMDMLGVRFIQDGQPLNRIPKTGPLVAVCNHPFGILEGLLLVRMLSVVRTDIKIMANFMLGKIPEVDDLLIEVDPFGRAQSPKKNIAGLKASMQWLRDGGMLVVFPAGEVSSLKLRKGMVSDPKWSAMIGRIIRKTEADVLPVFFDGRNSSLFQALGLIHPKLRTVLLPHENLKHAAKPVRVAFGSVVGRAKMAEFESDAEVIEYLRFRTYLMRRDDKPKSAFTKKTGHRQMAPIANSRGSHTLASEVAALPDEHILIESGDFTVFQAGAFSIPRILREIGILREKTFRAVGEGTGKPMDIDEFDDIYRHLVLWNHAKREVAGAYRFGLTDEIMREHGPTGLYTSTLFDYRPGLIGGMGPALEMGRSFIVPEYQKSYQPLLLLWKGVAEFVVKNPKYTKLFGCVSISGEYSGISQELIVNFMEKHSFLPQMADMAKPRHPPKSNKSLSRVDFALPDSAFNNPEDVAAMVSDVEGGTPIPVLLRQYLKLGGKFLGFNVDPDFGNCLDGLILVDLMESRPEVLSRFMGKDGVARFLAANQTTDNPRKNVLNFAA